MTTMAANTFTFTLGSCSRRPLNTSTNTTMGMSTVGQTITIGVVMTFHMFTLTLPNHPLKRKYLFTLRMVMRPAIGTPLPRCSSLTFFQPRQVAPDFVYIPYAR
jgi:hypothetical protein